MYRSLMHDSDDEVDAVEANEHEHMRRIVLAVAVSPDDGCVEANEHEHMQRIVGGRIDRAGDEFDPPMPGTMAERVAVARALSIRLHAMMRATQGDPPQPPGIPDRLIGGKRRDD